MSIFPYLCPFLSGIVMIKGGLLQAGGPFCAIFLTRGDLLHTYCWHDLLGTCARRQFMLDRWIPPRHYLSFLAWWEIRNLGARLGLIRLSPMPWWDGPVLGSGSWARFGLLFTVRTIYICVYIYIYIYIEREREREREMSSSYIRYNFELHSV